MFALEELCENSFGYVTIYANTGGRYQGSTLALARWLGASEIALGASKMYKSHILVAQSGKQIFNVTLTKLTNLVFFYVVLYLFD